MYIMQMKISSTASKTINEKVEQKGLALVISCRYTNIVSTAEVSQVPFAVFLARKKIFTERI